MKLSKNFYLYEVEHSDQATRKQIDNTLPKRLLPNARHHARTVLQPIRDAIKKPIGVSSWYRSPELNEEVSGSENSRHMRALAADIFVVGWTPEKLARRIEQLPDLPFHKLILEFNGWVHISSPAPTQKSAPLRRVLTAYHDAEGAVQYARGIAMEHYA